jgi:DNA invertase Pin-like site-specific DNA recombinase
MSIYGYIRVSTDKQDSTNQKHEILEYANKEKMGNVDFIEETISSRVKFEKRDLSNLIMMMKDGDTLLVTELSRIGRSTMEVMSVFKTLVEKGVKTHIIKSNFKIGAEEDKITSAVLIFAFGLAAELERELISQRTKSALAKKKAEGMILGRRKGQKVKSKLDGKEENIKELLGKKISVAAIAKIHDVGRTTMTSFIKSRGLKKEEIST